jgi:CheY-like chemotaxis protein
MMYCEILIIDDDIDDREFLMDALIHSGVKAVKAISSADEALDYLHMIPQDSDLPKLIVTDLNMPGTTGLQLLQLLRDLPRFQNIPVIICSTSGLSRDISRCITSGAKEYMVKPYAFEEYRNIALKMKQVVCG